MLLFEKGATVFGRCTLFYMQFGAKLLTKGGELCFFYYFIRFFKTKSLLLQTETNNSNYL